MNELGKELITWFFTFPQDSSRWFEVRNMLIACPSLSLSPLVYDLTQYLQAGQEFLTSFIENGFYFPDAFFSFPIMNISLHTMYNRSKN